MSINKNIDILKYVMCIMIIMIHIGYSEELPVIRSAVPVFFIISSFLFYQKVLKLDDDFEKRQYFFHFIKRAGYLYLFWFIVLLPVTIIARGWDNMPILELLKEFATGILYKGTFPASWYISAYVTGISLTFLFRKHTYIMAISGLACYLLSCAQSNYFYLFDSPIFSEGFLFYNSFPVGMIFICMGRYFSNKQEYSVKLSAIGVIIGLVLLFIENDLICEYDLRKEADCYLSMLILAPSIFALTMSLPQIKKIDTSYLRKSSTIYYCSHFSIIIVLVVLFGELGKIILLVTVILCCSVLSYALIKLANIPKLRFLRFSY